MRYLAKVFGHLNRADDSYLGPVNAIQLRGNILASASGDATIKLWDIESGNCLKTFTGHTRGLACIQFSEDGKTIVSGGNDQSIRVWDIEAGTMKYEIKDAHKSLVRSLFLDSANGKIISGSYDQVCVPVPCIFYILTIG
jgi:F-box and WD-40 domain protein 1/11